MIDLSCYICGRSKVDGERFYNSSKHSQGNPVCNKHYLQLSRFGRILDSSQSRVNDVRACDICKDEHGVQQYNINGEYQGYLLCSKHRSQLLEYGEILERTKYDRNEIKIYGDYAEVVLYDAKMNEVANAIIDSDNIKLISQYKWGYSSASNYAVSKDKDGRHLMMHRLVLSAEKTDSLVDHKDRNGLNNRRSNLRFAGKSINSINTGIRSSNTSGVTGVSYSKSFSKWRSYINFEGNRIELGYSSDLSTAIKTRLYAELKYYPYLPPQGHLFNEYGIGVDVVCV